MCPTLLWAKSGFSKLSHTQFFYMGIPVKRKMQRDVACCEALAQAGLISDNVGAETGINNTFTTSRPLACFLERIALLSAMFHVLLAHRIHD